LVRYSKANNKQLRILSDNVTVSATLAYPHVDYTAG